MKQLIVFVLILLALLTPCFAAESDAIRSVQEDALDLDALEDAAQDYMGDLTLEDIGLDQGLQKVLETGSGELSGVIRKAVRSSVLLLLIVLLCGVAEGLYGSTGETGLKVVPLVGALAVTAVAVTDVNSLLGMGTSTLDTMTAFANILMPTVAALTAATGAITGAAARQMAAVLFSDLLMNVINRLLVPLVYAYLAACIANAALGNEGLKRVAGMIKWVVTSVLTAILIGFVGYLSVSGIIAGTADAATIKATKFAMSSAVPVVGGILSDAAETVLASAGVLRSAVGVYGMIAVLMMCLLPFLQMGVHYLAYKMTSAISATVADSRTAGLIDQIGTAFGLILGMTGAGALLQLVALVSSLSVVTR